MASKKKPRKKQKERAQDSRLMLTEELIEKAGEYARKGNFRQDIAKRLKVNVGTWNSWLQRGREHLKELDAGTRENKTLQAILVETLDEKEAESRALLMEDCATSEDDRIKLQFLKLRYGQYFSEQRKNIDGDTGEVTERTATDLLAEKLAAFLGGDEA